MMAVADKYAHDANPKGIARLNYLAMAALGAIFGLVVVLFFVGVKMQVTRDWTERPHGALLQPKIELS